MAVFNSGGSLARSSSAGWDNEVKLARRQTCTNDKLPQCLPPRVPMTPVLQRKDCWGLKLLEFFSRKGKHIKTFPLWWSLGSVLRPKNHLSPWTQWLRGVTGSIQDEHSYPFIYSSMYTNPDFLHHAILEALKVLPPLTVILPAAQ